MSGSQIGNMKTQTQSQTDRPNRSTLQRLQMTRNGHRQTWLLILYGLNRDESVCSSAVPDSIHAFILSDEFNKLLDSKTELETTL